MNVTDLRIGSTFEMEGKIFVVVEYQKVSRPRLAALIRTKIKNVETGQLLDRNFGPADNVGEADIERLEMQFLYNDDNLYYFMDMETYEQTALNKEDIGENLRYLKEGLMVQIQKCLGRVISVVPPIKIEMLVAKCEPAVMGDNAKSTNKPATLENGFPIKVPMFIAEGDMIVVDTRTNEYVERVKNK